MQRVKLIFSVLADKQETSLQIQTHLGGQLSTISAMNTEPPTPVASPSQAISTFFSNQGNACTSASQLYPYSLYNSSYYYHTHIDSLFGQTDPFLNWNCQSGSMSSSNLTVPHAYSDAYGLFHGNNRTLVQQSGGSTFVIEMDRDDNESQFSLRSQLPMGSQLPIELQLPMGSQLPIELQLPMVSPLPNRPQLHNGSQLPMGSQLPNRPQLHIGSQLPMGSQLPNRPQLHIGSQLPMWSQLPNRPQMHIGPQLPIGSQLPNWPQFQIGSQLPTESQLPNRPQLHIRSQLPIESQLANRPQVHIGSPPYHSMAQLPLQKEYNIGNNVQMQSHETTLETNQKNDPFISGISMTANYSAGIDSHSYSSGLNMLADVCDRLTQPETSSISSDIQSGPVVPLPKDSDLLYHRMENDLSDDLTCDTNSLCRIANTFSFASFCDRNAE